MSYKSLIPASDWFYVHGSGFPDGVETVWHVAAFALADDGSVTGLIAVAGPLSGDAALTKAHPARLVTPPNVPDGRYLHRDQLTPAQLEATKKT